MVHWEIGRLGDWEQRDAALASVREISSGYKSREPFWHTSTPDTRSKRQEGSLRVYSLYWRWGGRCWGPLCAVVSTATVRAGHAATATWAAY